MAQATKPRTNEGSLNHALGNHSAYDKYTKEARSLPQAHVNRTDERPTKSAQQELKDIVFT